jgi:hypothetical protein
MNILEQEDLVKGLPDQVLIDLYMRGQMPMPVQMYEGGELQVQNSAGQIPQYLIVSEIGRRQKMRQSLSESVPEETVTEQIVQQGIASLNPNPDPLMNRAMGAQDPMMQDPMMAQMQDPMMQQQMMGQDPMMQQPPMDQQMMPPMMAAGGGMMPYRMAAGRNAPRMSQVPQLTQAQLNAILADGITAEEAELLASYGMSFDDLALGQRLNNPLNVRSSAANQWEGEDPTIREEEYEGFTGPDFGIRAADRVLDTYGRKRGIGTLTEALNRFAPESENPTQSYIDFVSGRSGIDPGAPIDLKNPAVRALLLSPMAEFESKSIYSPQDITESIARANELIDFASPALQKDAAMLSEEDVTPELVEASLAESPPAEREEAANLSAREGRMNKILAEARAITPEERERFIQEKYQQTLIPRGQEDTTPPEAVRRIAEGYFDDKDAGARGAVIDPRMVASSNPFKSVVDQSFSEVGPSLVQALEDRQELLNKQLQSDPSFDPLAGGDLDGIGTLYQGGPKSTVKRVPGLQTIASSPSGATTGARNNQLEGLVAALEARQRSKEEGQEAIMRSGKGGDIFARNWRDLQLAERLGIDDSRYIPLIKDLVSRGVQVPRRALGQFDEHVFSPLVSGKLEDQIDRGVGIAASGISDASERARQAYYGLDPNAPLYDPSVAGVIDEEGKFLFGGEPINRERLFPSNINVLDWAEDYARRKYDDVAGIFSQKAFADEPDGTEAVSTEVVTTDGDKTDVKETVVDQGGPVDGTQGGTKVVNALKQQELAELRKQFLDTSDVDPTLKPSFAGTDPAIGGLALAQLGAGIAQGDISAGLTGATKVIGEERDRKSREEYYKALTEKANRGSVTLYEDAIKLAYEILSKDPMTAFEGVDGAKADALAKQIMSGQFDMSALAGDGNKVAVDMSPEDYIKQAAGA